MPAGENGSFNWSKEVFAAQLVEVEWLLTDTHPFLLKKERHVEDDTSAVRLGMSSATLLQEWQTFSDSTCSSERPLRVHVLKFLFLKAPGRQSSQFGDESG